MFTKISKKASKKLPSFSWPNPDCPVGYCSFDIVKGYQNIRGGYRFGVTRMVLQKLFFACTGIQIMYIARVVKAIALPSCDKGLQ